MGISEWKFEVHFKFEHDNGKNCLLSQLIKHEDIVEYLGFKISDDTWQWYDELKMALINENDSEPSIY